MPEPKKTLKNIESYRVEPFSQPWLMKLDSNENYLGPSPNVMKRLENLQIKDISLYPCYGSLYEKIAQINNVSTDNLAVTNGADEALNVLINAYLYPDETLLTVTPSFSMPEIYTKIIGANFSSVPYKEKWVFPQEDFINSIDKNVKIILLTTPNNPTGDLTEKEFLESLLESFPEKLIIADETYATYADVSCYDLINKYNNLAVVRSLSKDYALAGLRIGYILADSEIIVNVRKILNPYSVNNIASICACEALNDKRYIRFVKRETDMAKVILTDGLEKLGAIVYKSYANFVLVDFKEKSDEVYKNLKEKNIIVKNYPDSETLKTCLRITIPTVNAVRELLKVLTPKDSIVFDMDGVLIDVSNSYRCAIQKTYAHFTGLEISPSEIQNAKNRGGLNNDWDLTHFLISETGKYVSYEDVVNEFQKIYWADGTGVINDEELMVEKSLLKNLANNYSLAIFTGRPRQEAIFTLEKFGLKDLFSVIITMDDLPKDKQKPDTLGLDIIKKTVLPLNMYYLGDTTDDMTCGKNYNIHPVGVLPPNDKSDGLKDLLFVSGAKYVINNVNEIKNILENTDENRQNRAPY